MLWLAAGAKPFVMLLSGATAAVLKLLRIDSNAARVVTEEDPEWTRRYHSNDPQEKAFGGSVAITLTDGGTDE